MIFLPSPSFREIVAYRWNKHQLTPHWTGEHPIIFEVDDDAVNPWDEGQPIEHLGVRDGVNEAAEI